MATEEEYKSLQAQLQKSRDNNKKLVGQIVAGGAASPATSNLEKKVQIIIDKFGEYEDLSEIAELATKTDSTPQGASVQDLEAAIKEAGDDFTEDQYDEVVKLAKDNKIADAIALVKGTKETPVTGAGSVDEQVAIAMAKRGVVDNGETLVPSDDFDADDLEKWRKAPMAERLKSLDKVKAAMLRG